jgi:hypothetical protein
MLVQIRHDRLRLIAQHHHALVSGALAVAWCGVDTERTALAFEAILAITLHDLAWLKVDPMLLFDPGCGRPYDFVTYPLAEKLAYYCVGIDDITQISPYAGLLASLHYTTFKGTEGVESFQSQERVRQQQLKQHLGLAAEDEPQLQTHLHYLKLFDNISLFICLTPPSAAKESRPSWLHPSLFAKTQKGKRFDLTWQDDHHLVVHPFPFREPVHLHIPYHDLMATSYATAEALQTAWDESAQGFWPVTIQPRLQSQG